MQMLVRRFAEADLALIRFAVRDRPEQGLHVVAGAAEGAGQAGEDVREDGFLLRPHVVHGLVERLAHQFAPDAVDVGAGEPVVVLAHDRVGEASPAFEVAGALAWALAVEEARVDDDRLFRILLAGHVVFAEGALRKPEALERIAGAATRILNKQLEITFDDVCAARSRSYP